MLKECFQSLDISCTVRRIEVKYSNSGRGLCWSGFWVSSVRSGAWFGVEVDLTCEIGFRRGLTYVVLKV